MIHSCTLHLLFSLSHHIVHSMSLVNHARIRAQVTDEFYYQAAPQLDYLDNRSLEGDNALYLNSFILATAFSIDDAVVQSMCHYVLSVN